MRTHTASPVLQGTAFAEEIELETGAVRAGVQRYRRMVRDSVKRGDGPNLKPAERLLLHWYKPMLAAVRQELRDVAKGADGTSPKGRMVYGRMFKLLDAERLTVVTIHEVLNLCMQSPSGVKVVKMAKAIGRAVAAEIHIDAIKAEGTPLVKKLQRRRRRMTPQTVNHFARKMIGRFWPAQTQLHAGVRLLWTLVGVASLDDYDRPFVLAFHHKRWGPAKRACAYIVPDRELLRIIEDGHALRQFMRPRYLPMIVPPCPWTKDAQGGYVRIRTPYISKPTPSQKSELMRGDLSQVNDCLNALAATGWRIHKGMLAVVRQLWEAGGGSLKMPLREDRPLPPKPTDMDDPELRKKWKAEASLIHKANCLELGKRIEFLNKLDVAERMTAYDAIYFPHQFDFRGRCYPVPVHLNHQGDDVCRALMIFSQPRDLDDRARRWLKVHAANCYGIDKVSFDQRLNWVEQNRDWIEAAAHAQTATAHLWQQAKKPLQFLAACTALVDDEIGARMPIQLDGTCNGLQHYAALGRDARGAAAVNLVPSESPADVYADVARVAARIVSSELSDTNNGHEFIEKGRKRRVTNAELAKIVDGMIDRSVVKSTVMTSVYGVTMVGARKQVMGALKEAGLRDEDLYKAGIYLSRLVLRSLRDVCGGATSIMDWLRACAVEIAERNKPVAWTTPLGLPVLQPYRKYFSKCVKAVMQQVRVRVEDEAVPIAVGRQCDGFAPNFIHSVDATHMLDTARRCRADGIAFAAVHDSYWTHAATADRMARVLRESFVELHSKPILSDLHSQLTRRYEGVTLPEPPPQGDFRITEVLKSEYFFS